MIQAPLAVQQVPQVTTVAPVPTMSISQPTVIAGPTRSIAGQSTVVQQVQPAFVSTVGASGPQTVEVITFVHQLPPIVEEIFIDINGNEKVGVPHKRSGGLKMSKADYIS